MDPLPLADIENVHNLVNQDRKLTFNEPFNIKNEKSKQKKVEDNKADFQTLSKVRNFVNKYYKDCDSNQGL